MAYGLRKFLLGVALCGSAIAVHGTQEVYVWQRAWNADVTSALLGIKPQIDGCCVLVGEISWRGERPQIVRIPLETPALAALGRPVGLALRIGPYSGPFESDNAATRTLVDLATECLKKARATGLEPAELQVDFDCAESKLTGYRTWLLALRSVTGKTRLVFTALPAWLRHSEFGELVRAADGFVLQVHSLEKPTGPTAAFLLCDPERAVAWARLAGTFGTPFRVALPTYGYLLAFDATGKFLALAAEAAHPVWPPDTQIRVVRADALAMAQLSQRLASDPPPHCTGTIWFRLPVAGDRLNWDHLTLETVLRGKVPRVHLDTRVEWPEPGLAEIVVVNAGETTEPLPATATVHLSPEAHLLAADGLGGFRLELPDGAVQGIVRAADVPPDAILAPGRSTKVAWLRFAHETPIDVALPAPP